MLLAATAPIALSACNAVVPDAAASTDAPAKTVVMDEGNPLLAPWTGPYEGVPPWDKIKTSDFPGAFQQAMINYKAEQDAILSNPEPATFANTIVPLELMGKQSGQLFAIWGVHSGSLSNPEIQVIEGEWEPKMQGFFTEMELDPRLFARIKTIYDARDSLNLDAEQMRVVEMRYEDLVKSGALLDDAGKTRLIAISGELAGKFAEFSKRVLADEESYILFTDPSDVAGVPDSVLSAMKSAAEAKGLQGWAAVNTRSVMQPILENCTNRDSRRKVFTAFAMRGDNNDANDTSGIIADILQLRQERAALLGYKTHANFRMTNTMAKEPEAAMDLMMRVWPAAVARVKEEVADMQAVADREAAAGKGPKISIEQWDYRFYAEKVRKEKYDLDSAELKPYFQLDKMMDAMFDSAGRLYGMKFTENTGAVPVFHPDVRTFEVSRDGKVIGLFYLDNYARPGKRSGAWMTTYKDQNKLGNSNLILASNNNNFVKPAAGETTLISLDDASTLFHEFGHAIHYYNYDITYPTLGETPRDYVEFPSQVNENWLMTPYVLEKYAVHYKTGKPIPAELLAKVEASETFMQGFATTEYLASAILDMKLHNRSTPVTDVKAFERDTLAEIGMPREMVMRHRLTQFNHLFSSDAYSAGYYSYIWSDVMGADAWAAFTEIGVWDKPTAERFRTEIFASGNSYDRKVAYRNFRGRDPKVESLLKQRGFPTGSSEQK
jgi:peptidyl-dipeptidase Dcp